MVKVIPPKPDLCDVCLEKKDIMMWDEDEEQWACIECMNDLIEERKLLDNVEFRSKYNDEDDIN